MSNNIRRDLINKASEIAAICMQITQKTKHDAFFRYSGHVHGIEVDVNIGGWKHGKNPDRHYEGRLHNKYAPDEVNVALYPDYLEELKNIEYELLSLLPD